MQISVHVFARLKDYFEAQFELELPAGATVADAVAELARLRPPAAEVLASCRAAVAEEIVPNETPLVPGAELFLLPPPSGG